MNSMIENIKPLEYSKRNWLCALIMCFLAGNLGLHRFYCDKIGTGILYLFTFGLFGIGSLVDLIFIVCNKFRDKQGRIVRRF